MLGTSKNIWDFDPRSVPGCGLWLDANDPSGTGVQPANSSTVSTWVDKSGNANNGTSGSATFQRDSLGGYINFTGSQYYNITNPSIVVNQYFTVFMVEQIGDVPLSSAYGLMGGTATPDNGNLHLVYRTANTIAFAFWNNDLATGMSVYGYGTGTTQPTRLWSFSFVANSRSIFLNGTSITSDTNNTFLSSATGTAIGRVLTQSYYTGKMREVMIYSGTINTTQRKQIEGFLARKWKLTLENLFIPTTVSNCVLWLDADDSTKFTGGSSWLDKSGTNNHGINGTPGVSAMPTVTTWTNGRRAARFVAGSKNSMKTTNSVVNFVSYFMVARVQAAVGYGFLIINNLDGQRQFVMNSSSFPLSLFWAPGGTAINLGSFSQGEGFVFCGTVTSGSGIGYINGTQVGSNTNPSTSGSSQNYFGSGNGDGGYLTIDIAEILIYTGVVSTVNRQSIENYLSIKWNIPLSRSGVTINPFNYIRPFSRRFNPIDISGCQVWFDGADQGSMTFSGSTITQWRDKSGNGYHATISSGRIGATYSSGLKCVYFQSPSVGYQTSYPANPTNETMFVVANIDSPSSTNNNTLICGQQGARSLGVGWNGGDATTCAYLNSLVAWRVSTPSGSYAAGTTALITGQVSSGTSLSIAMNGATFSTGSESGFYANTTTHLGVDTLNTVYYYKGFVMEILFYNSVLTTSQRQQVEGYLAYKWGLVSLLPSTHSFKKFPSTSPLPFLPRGISGCQLWLDGADPAGTGIPTSNGATVSTWIDKSGNGYNATANVGGSAITIGTLNNVPAITFPAASTAAFLLGSTLSVGSSGYSVFFVANQTSFASSGTRIYAANSGGIQSSINNGNSPRTIEIYNGTNMASSFTVIANTPFLYSYTISSTASGLWKNGSSTATGGGSTSSISNFYIGNYSSPASNAYAFTGQMGEFIIYNKTLTTSERQQVEGYLADKWGLKSSIPSTHLYRSFPPSFLPYEITASGSGDYSNFLWTRFYNITSDPSINGPGSSGWGSLIGTAGAYNPINYQDSDSRIGQSDFVGVVSKGFMYSATATVVTFRTISDDGIVVIFNGSNVIQNWTYHGDTVDTSASVTLPAGYTPIELRFFEWGGGFTCELSWSIGSTGSYVSDGTSRMFHNNTSKT